MNNCPELWDKLLKQAPKGSALMGGAVIDYLLGIPVNDYDIFYAYKPGQLFAFPGNWVPTQADFNDPVWIKEHAEAYLQGVDNHGDSPISTVYEYLVDGQYKVQLIGVNYPNPLTHMDNFDHSLTLAAYNSKGMFISKKVFEAEETRTIKYVSKNLDPKAVAKSLERANKKAARIPFGGAWKFEGFVGKPQPEVVGIDW